MDKFSFGYSTKNIPIPNEKYYLQLSSANFRITFKKVEKSAFENSNFEVCVEKHSLLVLNRQSGGSGNQKENIILAPITVALD